MVNPGGILGTVGGLVGNILANKRAIENEKKAKKYDSKAINNLENFKTYEIGDLHKDLEFGDKKNNLQTYRKGEDIAYQKLGNTNFNNLAADDQLSTVGRENIEFLKARREAGLGAAEAQAMKSILDVQQNAIRSAQNTITERAKERGADPFRVDLTARLLSTQANAQKGSKDALAVANSFSDAKVDAAKVLEGSLAAEFQRQAEIASARDRFVRADVDSMNKGLFENRQRANSIDDRNTSLRNSTSIRNVDSLLAAQKNFKDSINKKNEKIADYYANQASVLRGGAQQERNRATDSFNTATRGLTNTFSGML